MIFEVVLNKKIEQVDLNSVILKIEPLAKICNNIADFGTESNVIAEINLTDDPKWPCYVTVDSNLNSLCRETSPIDFAHTAHNLLELNCIIDTCELVSGLDDQDPFWCFAQVDGLWYFASTRSMYPNGTYIDGKWSVLDGDILLLKLVDLQNPSPNMFSAAELGANKAE